jgi:branched-chain amino acid aminotransferase
VFEGERIYNGRIFKSIIHSQRLHASAEILGFSVPYSVEELEEAKSSIVKKQNITDGYMRAFAWRGSEKMAISAQNNKIHVAIATWPWPPYYSEELHEKGIKLDWAMYRRPDPATAPVAAKAAGLYMICTISKHKAEREGYSDALMLDYRGYVAEATGANFFIVIDGELHTPLADCFLNGITRQTVIALAKDLGVKVVERRIEPSELAKGQEAFLTGSAAEITPVGQVAEYHFTPGPVTKKLKEAYHQLVRAG